MIRMRYVGVALTATAAALCLAVNVEAQAFNQVRSVVVEEALRFLKASDQARNWNESFHRAPLPDVLAFGPSLRMVDSGDGASRIRANPNQATGVRLMRAGWCQRPDFDSERARCAFEASSRYYVDVSDPVFRAQGDSARVAISVFAKDITAPSEMQLWRVDVWLVREPTGWRGTAIYPVRR